MIYYPLNTLAGAGIKDILIVTGKGHAGSFLDLLGSGSEFGVKIMYEVQESACGIANALGLAKGFVGNDKMTVILGDNIFEDDISEDVKAFESQNLKAKVFLKEVQDPERFGVAEIKEDKIVSIEEKPKNPKSNLATVGLYMYDNDVFDIIETLTPSKRGEYEITDVNNEYLKRGQLTYSILKGSWTDAGTFESLFLANKLAREKYGK